MNTRINTFVRLLAVYSPTRGCLFGAGLLALTALAAQASAEEDWANMEGIQAAFVEKMTAVREAKDAATVATLKGQLTGEKKCRLDIPPGALVGSADRSKLYEKCRPGVVVIGRIYKCGKCTKWHSSFASGFVIRPEGVVVTCHHVLAKDERGQHIGVMTHDGRVLKVTGMLACSKKDDLLILKVDAKGLTALPVASSAPVGSRVYAISHPVGRFYTMTEGIVSGYQERSIAGQRSRVMAITADYAKGSSGAPVVNGSGAVVGIARITEPVYYKKVNNAGTMIQMVWKCCTPSPALIELTKGAKE